MIKSLQVLAKSLVVQGPLKRTGHHHPCRHRCVGALLATARMCHRAQYNTVSVSAMHSVIVLPHGRYCDRLLGALSAVAISVVAMLDATGSQTVYPCLEPCLSVLVCLQLVDC